MKKNSYSNLKWWNFFRVRGKNKSNMHIEYIAIIQFIHFIFHKLRHQSRWKHKQKKHLLNGLFVDRTVWNNFRICFEVRYKFKCLISQRLNVSTFVFRAPRKQTIRFWWTRPTRSMSRRIAASWWVSRGLSWSQSHTAHQNCHQKKRDEFHCSWKENCRFIDW